MQTIWGERLAAVAASLFAVWFMYIAWDFPANGNIFPVFCGFMTFVVSALMILRTFTSPAVFDGLVPRPDWRQDAVALFYAGVTVGYVLLIFVIGYYSASLLFLVLMAVLARVTRKISVVISAAVTLPLIYVGFEILLRTRLPRGLFF